jgi:hypothetical protein
MQRKKIKVSGHICCEKNKSEIDNATYMQRKKKGVLNHIELLPWLWITHCSGAEQTMKKRHSRDIYGLPT